MGEGKKFDQGKLRWDLVPWESFEKVVEILTYGAEKYDAYDWTKLDNWRNRYFSAAMRHLVSWFEGETIDQESGKTHLAHAATNLLFLMWFENNR